MDMDVEDYDVYLSGGRVKLAQPLKYMDYYIYEIMSYAEILPVQEQKKMLRKVVQRAVKYGAFTDEVPFKHNLLCVYD